MSQDIDTHAPSPEFRRHLEWQIESALRRESRFAAPVAQVRRLRAAVVLLAALAVGGLASVATGQVQDAQRRDLLIETARSEEQLARVRLELAQADYEQAMRGFEVGTVTREALLTAERQMRTMQAALEGVRIDLEEIRATASAPRNELSAPLVGPRDFVRERLQLELEAAQQVLIAAEQTVTETEQRVRIAIAPRTTLLQAEAELLRARARMLLATASIELRQRFLQGGIAPEQIAPTLRRTELGLQAERVQREVDLARARIVELRQLVSAGQATELDLKRAEVELLEREMQLQLIRTELEMLARG
jgi:outer membrane protein TolC